MLIRTFFKVCPESCLSLFDSICLSLEYLSLSTCNAGLPPSWPPPLIPSLPCADLSHAKSMLVSVPLALHKTTVWVGCICKPCLYIIIA